MARTKKTVASTAVSKGRGHGEQLQTDTDSNPLPSDGKPNPPTKAPVARRPRTKHRSKPMKTAKALPKKNKRPRQAHICPDCSDSFDDRSNLLRHYMRHTGMCGRLGTGTGPFVMAGRHTLNAL